MKKIMFLALLSILSIAGCSQAEAQKDKCPGSCCCCQLVYSEPHLEEASKCHKDEVMVGWQGEQAMCSKVTIKCGVCPTDK